MIAGRDEHRDRASQSPRSPQWFGFCPRPLPGESLLSWIDQVSATFGFTRDDAAELVGISRRWGDRLSRDLYMLSRDDLPHLMFRTGLGELDLRMMTAEWLVMGPWAGCLRGRYYGIQGFDMMSSAACPDCVAESDGRWQLLWKSGFNVLCAKHRCYLASVCVCGRRLHRVDRGEISRFRCVGITAGQSRGFGPCDQKVADLPVARVEDPRVVQAHAQVFGLITSRKQRTDQQNERVWSDLAWAIHLTAELGTAELVEGTDPCVAEAFDRFCHRRESTRTRHGDVNARLKADEQDERLVMAAFLRVATALALSDDQGAQAMWFCDTVSPQWKSAPQVFIHLDPKGGLPQVFRALGMPNRPWR
ncbi:TniQ family protein [Nocardia sp. NPDC050175]|uniref:TniQ family protein n=1 Tax=Nocardia sp. NPDC050175 TaxID=3364317 RepID=UPI00379ABC47